MKIVYVQEREFKRYHLDLADRAKSSKDAKGPLAREILQDLQWQDKKTIAAVERGTCLGMMSIDNFPDYSGIEIEYWVTACGTKGVGKAMIKWLNEECHFKKIRLFPTVGQEAIYQKMGFHRIKENVNFFCWNEADQVPPPPSTPPLTPALSRSNSPVPPPPPPPDQSEK